jgi:deoxyuridine 5'-triphosphate nucleotidohydrolase
MGSSDSFFETVDSEAKAYLLGWIASDGAINRNGTISIALHRRDAPMLEILRRIICEELPVRPLRDTIVSLTIPSKAIVASVCKWLDISPGKKSQTVGFPPLGRDDLKWAFLRAYFEGDGTISSAGSKATSPRCSITTNSPRMKRAIREFCGVKCSESADELAWQGNNALDFLSKLYDNAGFFLPRKRDRYLDWASWVPALSGGGNYGRELLFRWTRTHTRAVAPFKARASDSGYDLTLIEKGQSSGLLTFYRTGIKIEPEFGWYFDVVPRSSIVKTGHMLANGIGVIDRSYRGEILVPLIKVDPQAPELELPSRIVQLVPRPIVHLQLRMVEDLEDTARGAGGFGSTGEHRE